LWRALFLLALAAVVLSAVTASAALLQVNGGVLQVFVLPANIPMPIPQECKAAGMSFTWSQVITGTAGNDIMEGQGGNDRLYGGPGNDDIDGGGGHDYINGGDGQDRCRGGGGNDTIVACETIVRG
jgi:Ca2+-binding RTX toxin-like protein